MSILPKQQRLSSLLGLALDGSRLNGLVLRRADGVLHLHQSFSISLSLDPLTNAPELVGREIRNHLDAAGVRERQCIVSLPIKWALTTHIEIPEMPEADIASFLQIEAERSLPCDVQTLHVAASRCKTPSGKQHAILVGIPRSHLALLEQELRAAKLKPISFTLGLAALQPPEAAASDGVMALAIGESHVGLQVTVGGGVAALRALEGAVEVEGGERVLHADLVAREARITLGQLPPELRETVRRVRVFGPPKLAQQLVDEMELRLDSSGLKVEAATLYAASEFGVQLPPEASVSQAFSLAAGRLTGRQTPFEFLLPKVTPLQQFAARHSSGKLRVALLAAAAVVLVAGGLFFFQQCRLWRLESQWKKLQPSVVQLEDLQEKIKQYRPWFDESVRGLTILRCLTEAFPQDGSVTAKTVEIRNLGAVTCTGSARDRQSLLATVAKLRKLPQFRDVALGPTRGQPPAVQFTFNLRWNEGGASGN
ncbi:MAG TPA: hypothetical protein P5205_06210 [Candidatus Paceibacterota bacterium]|nr:hypothetical protein [Verrucomicrobiota bacterium]HSA09948.1 hypothetical protein [Candidatus Paceibacterota bacterium]